MKEASLEQSPKQKEVLVLIDGKEVPLTEAQFQEKFGVQGWVRIPADEFGTIRMEEGKFGHFNLGKVNHIEGKRYLILKIQRHGAAATDTEKEVPPLLSLDGAFVGLCVRVEKDLRYDALTEEHFKYSMSGVGDKDSLPGVIQKRYASVRGLSNDEIMNKGVTYTLFDIEEKLN